MIRYEFIDGDTRLINQMVADGWRIENTFPNPNPQPYFFALMKLEGEKVINTNPYEYASPDRYDLICVTNFINGRVKELKQWKPKHADALLSELDKKQE